MGLRDPDFLCKSPSLFENILRNPVPNVIVGATLDIAIWSTVEQGLAITAGSLATVRPLLKALGYKLGMNSNPSPIRDTDDITRRPSVFVGGTNHARASRFQGGHEESYNMSYFPCKCCGTFHCQKRQSDGFGIVRSSMGLSVKVEKGDVHALSSAETKSPDGSDEELNVGSSTRETSNDTERVVPQSFLATEHQKN